MKKIVEYKCEICGNRYKNEKDALRCEAQGVDCPESAIGLIRYEDRIGKRMFFVICRAYDGYNKHQLQYGAWGFRETIGDNTGEQTCQGHKTESRLPENFHDMPEFKRAISYMNSVGMKPLVMVDGVIKPLEYGE